MQTGYLAKEEDIPEEIESCALSNAKPDEPSGFDLNTNVGPRSQSPLSIGQSREGGTEEIILPVNSNVDLIVDVDDSIVLASELTPLSSPVLSARDSYGTDEPLSPLSSPPTDPC